MREGEWYKVFRGKGLELVKILFRSKAYPYMWYYQTPDGYVGKTNKFWTTGNSVVQGARLTKRR